MFPHSNNVHKCESLILHESHAQINCFHTCDMEHSHTPSKRFYSVNCLFFIYLI